MSEVLKLAKLSCSRVMREATKGSQEMKYKISVLIVSAYDDDPLSVRNGTADISAKNGLVRARVAIDGEVFEVCDVVSSFDEVDSMVHQAANELLICSGHYTSCQIGTIGYDAA